MRVCSFFSRIELGEINFVTNDQRIRGGFTTMRCALLLSGFSICVIVAAQGCGAENDDRVEVYPVSGKVFVGGKPIEGISVIFYGQAPAQEDKRMPVPAGVTDANGEFRLTSYDSGDGAPAGEYKVAVIWNEPPPPNFSGVFEPRDRLGGRYASPNTSKLTATVPEGGAELPPFQL